MEDKLTNEESLEALKQQEAELQKQMEVTKQRINELQVRLDKNKDLVEATEKERDTQTLRLNYLKMRDAVRKKYAPSDISNDTRQRELFYQGIRPKKMDVVHFHVPKVGDKEEMDGVALVRDENHYYLAVDMFEHPDRADNTTTMMDENPDGTFDGIWPKYTILKAASRFEERYIRNLTDQYADDLDKAETFIQNVAETEAKEMDEIEARVAELNEILAESDGVKASLQEAQGVMTALRSEWLKISDSLEKLEAQQEETEGDAKDELQQEQDGLQFVLEDPEYEPMEGIESDTDIEKRCPHLPYLRGKRQLLTMNWPAIDTEMEPWLRYRLMGNVARLIDRLKEARALTYILSEEYFEELKNRSKMYYKGMMAQDVVASGEISTGVLVYPSQGYEDTILFDINCRSLLNIRVLYIREGRLMFYESFSMQEIIGNPRTDAYLCKSLRETGTDQNRLFGFIRNLVVSFLAMERDMERTVRHLIDEGEGSETELKIEKDDAVDSTDDRDIAIRDASWYTDLTVNRLIPVRGFISHRLCGTGKDKYVKEVWVRPHVRKGYHRAAKMKDN